MPPKKATAAKGASMKPKANTKAKVTKAAPASEKNETAAPLTNGAATLATRGRGRPKKEDVSETKTEAKPTTTKKAAAGKQHP